MMKVAGSRHILRLAISRGSRCRPISRIAVRDGSSLPFTVEESYGPARRRTRLFDDFLKA